MSEPAAQPQAKQGMSTGIKVLLGCLLALVILGLGTCAACYYAAHRAKNFLEEKAARYQNDPDAAAYDAAVMAFKMNPDTEIVSSDENAKTITVRDKKSGKEITFNLDDIKSGNLSIESGGEKVNVGFKGGENGEGGSMTVESEKGKMTLGAGETGSLPDWIPSYPGARVEGVSALDVNGEKNGTFTIHTSDSVDQVLAFYEAKLKDAGFEVNKASLNIPGAVSANLTAKADNRTLNVTAATQEGETQGLVAYSEKQ
jgi:hypothetical protein